MSQRFSSDRGWILWKKKWCGSIHITSLLLLRNLRLSRYTCMVQHELRWEFIKENKKVRKQKNKNSTMTAIKKTRKQELDQESDQEKKKNLLLITFLVKFLFSCFLTFLFSFINSHLWMWGREKNGGWREERTRLYYASFEHFLPWWCN